jgi:hypothetical protein
MGRSPAPRPPGAVRRPEKAAERERAARVERERLKDEIKRVYRAGLNQQAITETLGVRDVEISRATVQRIVSARRHDGVLHDAESDDGCDRARGGRAWPSSSPTSTSTSKMENGSRLSA